MDIARVELHDIRSVEILSKAWKDIFMGNDRFLFICVGTEKTIGDSVAPRIGSEISVRIPDLSVVGTVESPVHALNLAEVVDRVKREFSGYRLIAVDACLSRPDLVGNIYIKKEKLKPGLAFNRKLPPFGHYKFCANVNEKTNHVFQTLEETDPAVIEKMVDIMATSIELGWREARGDYCMEDNN